MPRVKLDPLKFKESYVRDKIRNSMRDEDGHVIHTFEEIGKLWNLSTAQANSKVRSMNVTYRQLLQLSQLFGWDEKERAKILEI